MGVADTSVKVLFTFSSDALPLNSSKAECVSIGFRDESSLMSESRGLGVVVLVGLAGE